MALSLDEVTATLVHTPAVLRALMTPLPDRLLNANDGEGTWSPMQVVRHLVWCEVDDWLPRARLILEHQDRVPFTPFDREAGEARFGDLGCAGLLDEFARLRAANMAALEGLHLTPADLALSGTHPALGPVTLEQLLSTWIAHDHSHVAQITRTLARQYTEAVGPWRAFMRTLQ